MEWAIGAGMFALRLVGLIWAIGGVVTLAMVASQLRDGDRLQETRRAEPEHADLLNRLALDRSRAVWIGVGGVLTVITGVLLLAESHHGVIALAALVLHQTLYARRQAIEIERQPDMAELSSLARSTRHAAMVSTFVFMIALLVWHAGGFHG